MKRVLASFLLILPLVAAEVGKPLPRLQLSGKEGGRVDGSPFDSKRLHGKVTVIFYVDPDKKSLNEPFTEALKAKRFDRSRYRSVAVVNMAATWLPDFAIAAALKSKQKKYPDTLYVRDRRKKGVRVWGVADDEANFLLVSKDGRVLYAASGKIAESEWSEIFSLIERAMRE
ncbi:YtfJ family protein [Hydrogenimonas urashimensis]|uniref:YtfJ family protein n=1 Tax=Hydrogenimonas urashimensis TaxID=2740515 RepID=UPI0019153498|nr:YtfJ family protein [Hydrogenimonas urashimensis]